MKARRIAVLFVLVGLFSITLHACTTISSVTYDENKFKGDPLSFLVGEWVGTVFVSGDKLPPDRFLIIYPQGEGTRYARYGVVDRERNQSTLEINVAQNSGGISVSFRVTGSRSFVTLWLEQMGGKPVLRGTLRPALTDLPEAPMLLTKIR